jgi:hypothetical protein
VLTWVVLMGLAAQRFLALPSRSLGGTLFGSPITLTITANTLLGALLAGLVATGAEAVVRAHDVHGLGGARGFAGAVSAGHWIYWGLPIALIAVALLLLPAAPGNSYWLVGLVLTGIALGLSMAGIYYTIDPFAWGYRRARLGLNTMTYTLALVLFLVVYRTRVRSIVSATEITVIGGLLALELLRGSERPLPLVVLYAVISGLIVGEATWALNYWRLDSLTGGLVLLLVFYNAVGLAQNAIQGQIRRRVLIEHALITVAGLALIWEFAP